jgi:serine/threonine-protein kinase
MARERDILASLEHPNIARLYDAGTDAQGRPFLALEYVEGQPIDVYCRERSLDAKARLHLLLQVAQAVAFAHSRLVVHRDLKPSNILVTADGQVRLLDFGIAKLMEGERTAETQLTQIAGRALTLDYASPEQIRGEPIGTASDVYSLGVVAYELLAGAKPYKLKRGSAAELEEAIAAVDAPLASATATDTAAKKALKGDLDAILNKALKKSAGERYATVDALAEDLQRWLRGQPVTARSDSVWYRLRKFIRRNVLVLSVASGVTIAVLLGVALAIVQTERAKRSAEREQMIKSFVAEVFRFSATSQAAGNPSTNPQQPTLLDSGPKLIELRFPGQPELQADMYGVVGRMFSDMGAYRHAADYYKRQLEILRLGRAGKTAQARAEIALSYALQADFKLDEARASARRALELAAGNAELTGAALSSLAHDEYYRGLPEAHVTAQKALQFLEDATRAPLAEKARARYVLAITEPGKSFDARLAGCKEAIEIARRAEGNLSRTAAELSIALGHELAYSDRIDEALHWIEPALETLSQRGGVDAVWGATWRTYAWRLLFEKGTVSSDEALRAVRESRSIMDRQAVLVPLDLRQQMDLVEGEILLDLGNIGESSEKLGPAMRALRLRVQDLPSATHQLARTEARSGMERGEHEFADARFAEALQMRAAAGIATSPRAAVDHAYRAHNRLMQGQLEKAREALDAAPGFAADPNNPSKGRTLVELLTWERARLALHSGNPEAALALMQPLARFQDGAERLSTSALEAEALCAARQHDKGLAKMGTVIEARASRADWRDPVLARYRAVAGLCALDSGDRKEAERMLGLARAALDAQPAVSLYYKSPVRTLKIRLKGR